MFSQTWHLAMIENASDLAAEGGWRINSPLGMGKR